LVRGSVGREEGEEVRATEEGEEEELEEAEREEFIG
jgi:hypothetical protein